MRILGVDPGTLVTGFGVIDCEGGTMSLVDYGIVRMKASDSLPIRLEKIHVGLLEVIERTAPDECAIESAFYSKNVQSTLKLGHARGVAILAAVLRQVPTSEYAPREIKQAVTGSGAASKEQVEYMVMQMLKIEKRHDFLDATDALAIAICHAGKINRPVATRAKDWKQFIQDNPHRVAAGR
jgi:crossover junction endodeoxyribonuclease RuvC